MVNFRFHVISVIAVFTALTSGLVLGTTALDRRTAGSAPPRVDAQEQTQQPQQSERDRIAQLNGDLRAQERLVEQMVPVVLAGRLAGKHVLIVTTPAAASHVEGVAGTLRDAGATVTGRLTLTDKFIDPANNEELLDLATAALPPSVTAGLPVGTNGIDASSSLLAAVLLKRAPAVTEADMRTVLSAYSSQGYVTAPEVVATPADAVVVLSDSTASHQADRATIQQFDRAGAVVVAEGGNAGGNGVVSRVRGDGSMSGTVSTVDNLGTLAGRLVTAWAVADQIAGRTGHYGTAPGVTLLPKLVS